MARKQADVRGERRNGNGVRPLAMSRGLDLLAAAALALLAGLAFLALPAGSPLRVALTLPVLFFVPGYLLIEAATESAVSRQRRMVRAWISIGVSPVVVALLALATVVLPGGFKPASIVATITLACLALAGIAMTRRLRTQRVPSTPATSPAA